MLPDRHLSSTFGIYNLEPKRGALTDHRQLTAAMSDHTRLGARGEKLAAERLQAEGYEILARNYRCDYGELDIIALDGHVLVFVEVKTRESEEAGSPLEAVTPRKQRQIARAALYFAVETRRDEMEMRFDVVGVEFAEDGEPRLEIVQDAFVADG